jgi:hypothetical protein
LCSLLHEGILSLSNEYDVVFFQNFVAMDSFGSILNDGKDHDIVSAMDSAFFLHHQDDHTMLPVIGNLSDEPPMKKGRYQLEFCKCLK